MVRSRGEEIKELAKEAGKRAQRWVVERTHSWMNRFRRIPIRWEKKQDFLFRFWDCAIWAWADIQQQRAVFADNVHQVVDDGGGCFVILLLQ
jgi:hypothetical protein